VDLHGFDLQPRSSHCVQVRADAFEVPLRDGGLAPVLTTVLTLAAFVSPVLAVAGICSDALHLRPASAEIVGAGAAAPQN
jgi:hypothetical protein